MELAGGVIAIGQVASSVLKASLALRKLWNEVREVPERIQELLDDLNMYEVILKDIDSQLSRDTLPREAWDSAPAKMSFEYCRKAKDGLTAMANDLSREIAAKRKLKKTVASTKVILKKDKIQGLERRLEKTLRMMELSMACYDKAVQRLSYGAVTQTLSKVSELETRVEIIQTSRTVMSKSRDGTLNKEESHQESWTFQVGSRTPELPSRQYRKPGRLGGLWLDVSPDGRRRRVSFQLPPWLNQTVWEFETRKACSGWDFHLRSYNILPSESLIFGYAADGDISKMQEMFSTNQASPYDRTATGGTLLHKAALHYQFGAIEWLLRFGLEPAIDERDRRGKWSPRQAARHWDYENPGAGSAADEFERLHLQDKLALWDLFEKASPEPISEGEGMSLLLQGRLPRGFNGLPDVLERFQRHYVPQYHKAALRDRLVAARNFTPKEVEGGLVREQYRPSSFHYLVNQDRQISAEDVRDSARAGVSVIHTAAMNFAIHTMIRTQLPFHPQNISEYWRDTVMSVAAVSGADELSAVEEVSMPKHDKVWTGTPLASLIHGFGLTDFPVCASWNRYRSGEPAWQELLHQVLCMWLSALRRPGFDLEEYGRREKEWFDKNLALPTTSVDLCLEKDNWGRPKPPRLVRLRNLRVGPKPEDWCLEWEIDELRTLREFWEGVERNLCPQPEAPKSCSAIPGAWVD